MNRSGLDLHLKTPLALESGCIYKIVSARSPKMAITFFENSTGMVLKNIVSWDAYDMKICSRVLPQLWIPCKCHWSKGWHIPETRLQTRFSKLLGHQFQAIGTGQTWAFKNVSNGHYLGIPLSTHQPKNGQVTSVVTPFTWMVLPDYRPNGLAAFK